MGVLVPAIVDVVRLVRIGHHPAHRTRTPGATAGPGAPYTAGRPSTARLRVAPTHLHDPGSPAPRAPLLTLIAAVARNGAIGQQGGLVFNEPADQRHFRETTLGCPVIMGRKTWDSLPVRFRPLPGRRNLVLSRDPGFVAPGAEVVRGLDEALAALAGAPQVFVIGGADLYAQALPRAQRLVLTEIDADLPGDAFFPPWPRDAFRETERRHGQGQGGVAFDFVTYERR